MQIKQIFKKFIVCILCIFCMYGATYAAVSNMPTGNVDEYGAWLNKDTAEKYKTEVSEDLRNFDKNFETTVNSEDFVPFEARIGFAFMRALSAIDHIMQISLVRFTIIFLFFMYAFWIALEAYTMIRDSTDYKKVFFEIFKKGITISIWVIVLIYGPAELFVTLISPIISFGVAVSDFILNSVASVFDIELPKTCDAIRNYINTRNQIAIDSGAAGALIDSGAAADIMCLPSRLSVYFYRAISVGFSIMLHFSITKLVFGAACIYIFIKCTFKYAFMTLGIVADLFLTLLMLPFTAIAEATPTIKESNYAGQIFGGLLKIFNTKKLSDVIATFVNTAVYFVCLSIIIAICAVLLKGMDDTDGGMMMILTGCLVIYLANKAEDYATKLGGKINNSFGKQLQNDSKTLWNKVKKFGGMAFKDWLHK